MTIVNNPILRGFNPDPSIIRVGKDYYIATSTFEWFPGVQIHHSRDLKNWRLLTRPLQRKSQLDLKGVPDSCGVWAPCLSYKQGIYYLVYTNVHSFDGIWKDTPNFLVYTDNISGDWSEPVFLSSYGFDGSLFHDEDGRKYFLCMTVDHRKAKLFGDIIIQEYDHNKKELIGQVHTIFKGTELGCTEGPHLYKKAGYYYLITAEGGTEYGHAVSIARSKELLGPYEVHPENPVISNRGNSKAELQKCGHADLFETESGDWYAVFLVGRPLNEKGRCTLGRETAIAKIEWKNDWPYLENGGNSPSLTQELSLTEFKFGTKATGRLYFNDKLDIHFQSLRIPFDESWITLKERIGYLRLKGRESLSSFHFQSLIARRVQSFQIEASCCLEFQPESFQQMAGLIAYYNTGHWFYLHIAGHDDGESRFLQLIKCDHFEMTEELTEPIKLVEYGAVYLKLTFHRHNLQFYYSLNDKKWIEVGNMQDGSILSDDYVQEGEKRYRPAFTGSFVGMCCQDLSGMKKEADFKWWEYKEM